MSRDSTGMRVVAGDRYEAGSVHRWFLGDHHRDVWTASVEVEFLDVGSLAGGLTPVTTGGGLQTRSLRFRGSDGREYFFRSLDKDPTPALDSVFRGTVVDDLVQDAISAAHPYGALVAARLLDGPGVLHADPQLLVMPDDPRLGAFRSEFAGMLGLFEERPDENDDTGGQPFAGATRVIGSNRLMERLDESPDDLVDPEAYLRARLMDVYLGDWDRHRGQWRWATYSSEDPRVWLPVPRDRDQVFSRFDGFLTSVAALYIPHLVRFGTDYPSMERLHWSAREMDRRFLAGLSLDDWEKVGASVQASLTDGLIDDAVMRLPSGVYARHGSTLAGQLRARRERLPEAWRDLYALLARQVEVHASDSHEVVVVDRSSLADVTVRVARRDDPERPFFQRTFSDEETREIRVHLEGGDDMLRVVGEAPSDITLRVVGGEGSDQYVFGGPAEDVHLYDHEGRNRVSGAEVTIDARPFQEWTWSPDDRSQPLDWGHRTLPVASPAVSSDLGVFLAGGVRIERYGFRQAPYASAVEIQAGWAPGLGRGLLDVDSRFNRANSPLFLEVAGRMSGVDVLHFYGLGNATAPGHGSSHRVDLRRITGSVGLGVEPSPWIRAAGTVQFEETLTQDRAADHPVLRSTAARGGYTALGIGGRVVVEPLQGSLDSSSDIRLTVEGMAFPAILDVDRTFGRLEGEFSLRLAPSAWPMLSLVVKAGAQQVLGRFPWHHAAFLGGNETLRGWDEERFAGDAAVRVSSEFRLGTTGRLVLPARMGVFAFVDEGRVWSDGRSPGGWHLGAGGGVYIQPMRSPYMLKGGVGVSEEATKVFVGVELPY
ncbi:MAG: hypothetical protein RLN75_00950 [Longimicrobiales bacterium]